jgi:putative transcriptional regulator
VPPTPPPPSPGQEPPEDAPSGDGQPAERPPADQWRPSWGLPVDEPSGPSPPLAGRVLVATPTIGDDRFAHTVILMLEHDPTGALGIVLNTPGDTPVEAVLADWALRVSAPPVVFSGGPVGADRALGLVRLRPGWSGGAGRFPGGLGVGDSGLTGDSDDSAQDIGPAGIVEVPGTAGSVGLVDLSRPASELDAVVGVEEVRVFAGYAGWGAGQLDAELEVGAWWDATASSDDVFTADPGGLWRRVVARQGGTRALFARFTGDPSLN